MPTAMPKLGPMTASMAAASARWSVGETWAYVSAVTTQPGVEEGGNRFARRRRSKAPRASPTTAS